VTAKEYLQQVFYLNKKINRMIREKEALQSILYSVGGVSNEERVQGGSVGNRTENLIAKIDEKERKINSKIDRLVEVRYGIAEEIYKIDNENYVEVLFKRYILLEQWNEIADEMGYTYQYTILLHGLALKEFQKFNEDSIGIQ